MVKWLVSSHYTLVSKGSAVSHKIMMLRTSNSPAFIVQKFDIKTVGFALLVYGWIQCKISMVTSGISTHLQNA